MTKELKAQIQRLRDLSPKLNAATDDANQVVEALEDFLNNQCSLGIPATEYEDGCEYPAADRRRLYGIAYMRVSGKYRIVTLVTVDKLDESDEWSNESKEEIAWGSATREVKLRVFPLVPRLLAALAQQAELATKSANETSAAVRDVLDALRR